MNDRERSRADTAVDWQIRLQDEPDNAELRASFSAWLRADPENERAWLEIQETRDAISAAVRRSGRDPAQADISPAQIKPRRSPPIWAMGGALATVLALAVFLAPEIQILLEADHRTATGQTSRVPLSDGSTVVLGADSAISLEFTDEQRGVRLLGGSAYFAVTPDAGRPFHVDFGTDRTTVVGTAFEVRMSSDGSSVAVEEGRVRVTTGLANPSAEQSENGVSAGQSIRLSDKHQPEVQSIEPRSVATWRRGKLIVKDRPAGDVIDELARYHTGLLLAGSGRFRSRRISGVFDLSRPYDAILTAARTAGADVYSASEWALTVRDR
ncbi:MAG: FecR domain-containing protein [Pseudomonadota bacterium]